MRSWLVAALYLLALLQPASADDTKIVVILHSYGQNFRPWGEYAKAIRQELKRRSPRPVVIQDFSITGTTDSVQNAQAKYVDYLSALFAGRPPDLIVAVGAPAADFVQRFRPQLFASTPMILTAVEQRHVQKITLTDKDVYVAVRQKFLSVFGNILQLLPETRAIEVVLSNSPLAPLWLREIQKETEPLKNRVNITFRTNMSFDDILKDAAQFPANSAIYWYSAEVDIAGAQYERERSLKKLYAVAKAPIFAFDDCFLTGEIVGGLMTSTSDLADQTTDIALKILGGARPADMKSVVVEYGAPKYDWRELQRWGISESQLPAGAEVLFRPPSLWETYRWPLALIAFVVIVQAALISALLHHKRRRIFAEVLARQRMSELAHVNRFSMAGALTASIAHELNQPLGAILTNVETLEVILKSPNPDLNEAKEIAFDIKRDDERASEVIRRLRSLLKKAPFELRDVDLNQIVGETMEFLSALAAGRNVELHKKLDPSPLTVNGDRVQLQQVMLNLIINAMEAVSGMPSTERQVAVRTASNDGFAEVTIADTGRGIPEDELAEIFEPFFTTKAQGMGMGLSIARTIVEAHGGELFAENQAGSGAMFRMKLPLA